jgi:hypothetical protein
MILVGKNYAGYGEFLDENFIHLLENSANTSAPGAPLTGQLWWDSTNALMKVYNGTAFKVMTGATSSASAPSNVITGDLWWDTTNAQLKVYNGASFTVVGPAFTSAEGTAGAIPETITDSGATPHYVTSLYVNNTRVAIVSKDSSFTPSAPTVTTFPTIYNGITLYNTGSPVFAGTVTNAALLDNLDSTDFMRATANTATTGRLQVNNANGIYIGTSNVVNISQSSNDGVIASPVSTGNLIIRTNVSGTTYTVATALGGNGAFAIANAATIGTTLSVTGNTTGGNLLTAGLISSTGNITGGNISATLHSGTTVSVSGNVTGGNLVTAGLIATSSTSNTSISTAGNIQGSYFYGNGSTLSGLSAAVSVTKFVNGSSEGNIGGSGANINFNVSGNANVLVLSSSTAYFASDVSVTAIQKTGSNAVGNIGSSANYFNRVFATATTALYADVAERFAADELLEPGTVVELGGSKEITRSQQDLSENVYGVISTRPAYTMNG